MKSEKGFRPTKMRKGGLEPPRPKPRDPKSRASTSSATFAPDPRKVAKSKITRAEVASIREPPGPCTRRLASRLKGGMVGRCRSEQKDARPGLDPGAGGERLALGSGLYPPALTLTIRVVPSGILHDAGRRPRPGPRCPGCLSTSSGVSTAWSLISRSFTPRSRYSAGGGTQGRDLGDDHTPRLLEAESVGAVPA